MVRFSLFQRTTFAGGSIGIEDSTGTQIDPVEDGKFDNETGLNYGSQLVPTPGSREPLVPGAANVTVPNNKTVLIRGNVSVAGNHVYVGDSAVSAADGYPLADAESVMLAVDNTSRVFLDADAANDGARWIVEG